MTRAGGRGRGDLPGGVSRQQLEELYLPPADDFVTVDVPEMAFFMLDGEGSPDDEPFHEAIQWLWTAVHPIGVEARKRMGRHFIKPPLEGLWWADDMADLEAGRKHRLTWRVMIPAPEWATGDMFAEGIAQAEETRGEAPKSLRLDRYHEGESVQIMHVGPDEEIATVARRLCEFLPTRDLVPNGPHHQIYLTDVKRTAPKRRKTVLRQPVRPA